MLRSSRPLKGELPESAQLWMQVCVDVCMWYVYVDEQAYIHTCLSVYRGHREM